MVKGFLTGSMLLILVACGNTTPETTVYQMRAAYDTAVLVPMVAYNELPRCSAVVPKPCSEQSVVVQMRKADAAVKAALDSAETIVADPNLKASADTALKVASEAIVVATKIVTIYGVK